MSSRPWSGAVCQVRVAPGPDGLPTLPRGSSGSRPRRELMQKSIRHPLPRPRHTSRSPSNLGRLIELLMNQGAKKAHKGMAHEGIFLGSRIVDKNGPNLSEISRGRWPCGREPPVKRRIPFPEHMYLCLCVSLGPEIWSLSAPQSSRNRSFLWGIYV